MYKRILIGAVYDVSIFITAEPIVKGDKEVIVVSVEEVEEKEKRRYYYRTQEFCTEDLDLSESYFYKLLKEEKGRIDKMNGVDTRWWVR